MRRILLISMTVLNLVLMGRLALRQGTSAKEERIETTSNPVEVSAAVSNSPGNLMVRAASVSVKKATQTSWRWSQIESADYPTYINNLRRIGCPESTIRDIISADLHALYEAKRRQSSPRESARLDLEERQTFSTLLGIHLDSPKAAEAQTVPVPALRHGLSLGPSLEAKRSALESWREHFEFAKGELLDSKGGSIQSEADAAQLKQLEAQEESILNSLLTPAERDEFDESNSPASKGLQHSLLGFDITDTEFRALLNARKELDAGLDAMDSIEQTEALRESFNRHAAEVLGEERFARFELAQDPEFQAYYAEAAGQGQSADTIYESWDRKQRQDSEVQIPAKPERENLIAASSAPQTQPSPTAAQRR